MSGILESIRRIMVISSGLDTTCSVLIFKANRGVIHHGAVAIARTLGRLGVPVYAIVEDAYTPLACSRYLTKSFIWDLWPLDDEALLKAISTIGEIIGRPTVLIPMDDLSAVFVAENAHTLRRWFLFPLLPSDVPRQLANKLNLHSVCARIGIPCARTVAPRSAADISEFTKFTTFPVVVKVAEQWRLLYDKYNILMILTQDALFKFCEQLEDGDCERMILQEFIPGEDWIYHGYCDAEKSLYVSFTGKKLLSYPPGAGSTALGLSLSNETLRCRAESLLRAISYSGITDMDWRLDMRDGQYKLLDCNPRVGMNFRMFENGAGIDVIRALHLNLTGRNIDSSPMVEHRLFIAESYRLLAFLRGGGRTALRSPENLHCQLRSREFAWWSGDDPLPVFVMSVRLLVGVVKRALRRIWVGAKGWPVIR